MQSMKQTPPILSESQLTRLTVYLPDVIQSEAGTFNDEQVEGPILHLMDCISMCKSQRGKGETMYRILLCYKEQKT